MATYTQSLVFTAADAIEYAAMKTLVGLQQSEDGQVEGRAVTWDDNAMTLTLTASGVRTDWVA